LEISEIRITLRDDNKLRGFASITLDNCFVIRGLKIIEGASGLFIAMPSRKRKDGTFQDIAHPINMRTRQWMESQVIAAYKQEMQRVEKGEIPPPQAGKARDDEPDSMLEQSY
jgi:stage V sporulation protein G